MFSKIKHARLSVFVLPLLITTGCGQFFGEKPPPAAVLDAKLGFETKCLENVLPMMKSFMAGTAKEVEIRGTWQCFGNGIGAFQRKVKGSQQNQYSAFELAKFFEDYFFVGIKITENKPLLQEVMRVKQLFIGGSSEFVTREELSRLIEFSKRMEEISIELLPYMKVFAMAWNFEPQGEGRPNRNAQYFENANLALQKAAKDLAALIARNEYGYRIRNFVVMMRQMEALYSEKWSWLDDVEKMMPLIEKFKETLAGGEPGVIAPTEWRRFALLGGRGFIQYLRYYYFIQRADEASGSQQVEYLTNSIDDLFSYLGDMVREKPSGVFTKQELFEVIDSLKQLFPKVNISQELIDQSMKIKTLLFGGSTEVWTPDDFVKAQGKVLAFRSLAERFLNFAEVYLMRWKAQDLPGAEAQEFFQTAENSLIESATLLGGLIETQYDLQDFVRFCDEIDRLFPPNPGESSWTASVRKAIPPLVAYKQIVLSDENSVVQSSRWNEFLVFTARIYSQALYANYFLTKTSLFYSFGLHSLDKFSRRFNGLLKELVTSKSRGGLQSVTYIELERLLTALYNSGYWVKGLKIETAKSLLHLVFDRLLLAPEKRLANEKPNGLSLHALSTLEIEYNLWSANQHLLEVLYQAPERELSTEVILDSLKKAEQTEGTRELIQIFTSPLSLSLRVKGRVEIKNEPSLYYLESASMMNLARVFSRAILRSYAMDINRIRSLTGVDIKEVDVLFAQVRPLIVELGLIEPDNVSFARNRFFESNLFTPTADGNDYMSFREGAHLTILIFSGLELNRMIDPVIREKCYVELSPTTRYRDRALVSCAAEVYFQNRELFFESMPEMKKFLLGFKRLEDFTPMFIDLLKAAGWKSNSSGTAMLGELGLVPHIFQYEEMLLQRFDSDKSGVLVDDEVKRAYPIYGPLIKTISPTKIETINQAIFYYLIKHGAIPKGLKEIKPLWKAVRNGDPLGIQTGRTLLAKVFGAIAEAVQAANKSGKLNIDENEIQN